MGLTIGKAKEIVADAVSKSLNHIIDRSIDIPIDVKKIVSLIGPRRAGKTSVCFQLIKQLRNEVEDHRLLYVNFEDDRFFPVELSDMDTLIQTYYSTYPENKEVLVWFFFDEVQEVPHWEKFIRRLNDQENCRIYITGSSSTLLSRELSTTLRGRTLTYEIFPLSFQEFLSFKGIQADSHSSKGKSILQHQLAKYIRQGGFPELIFLEEQFHRPTLHEYLNLMLYKDLTERFGIRNPHLIKYLLRFCLINLSKPISINKLYHDLKSQGYKVGKNTVYDYLNYLEEAFVIFRVSKWSTSIREQSINPDKVYAIDQGFKYILTGEGDEGRILESVIFMALRRIGLSPNYWVGKQEVDFYVEQNTLINVSLDLSEDSTRNREIEGLREAMEKTGIQHSILVTFAEEDEISSDQGTIHIVQARDFLLNLESYIK